MQNYDYGNSVISSNLKYEFKNDNVRYERIKGRFHVELIVYCGRKKMHSTCGDYENISINDAINKLFITKVENMFTFYKGKNYYAIFNVYELKPITRYVYKKTDTIINTKRRKYLFKERINIYF